MMDRRPAIRVSTILGEPDPGEQSERDRILRLRSRLVDALRELPDPTPGRLADHLNVTRIQLARVALQFPRYFICHKGTSDHALSAIVLHPHLVQP